MEITIDKFGLNSAYSIAKILLACGLIEESDVMDTAIQIMNGNLQLGKQNEKKEKSSQKN